MTSQDPTASPAACCGGCSAHHDASDDGRPAVGTDAAPGRRTVLRGGSLAALAGAGTLGLAACTQDIKDEQNAQEHFAGSEATDALAADELPVGATRSVEVDGRTLMMHRTDEQTVKVVSNVCTHQGCLVQIVDRSTGTAYACPCHGSNFDPATGEPFGGPARKPLMDYEATVRDGRIVVKL